LVWLQHCLRCGKSLYGAFRKTLNPQIRAIARASTHEALQKLQRAGADAVVSPYITGGKRMAAAALRPQVMDFVDGILTGADRELYMEELRLDPMFVLVSVKVYEKQGCDRNLAL
jgi:voltage-gated potassium channel Kch